MFILDNGENIVKVVRRHWFVMLSFGFSLLLMALAPVLLYMFGKYIGLSLPNLGGNLKTWITFLYYIWLLLLWTVFFIEWTDYYLDVLIITDRRVIEVEQKGFFRREVSTVRLDRIEDITVNVNGVLATFLDYGTIRIQSAAEAREFIIRDVPEPNKVKSVIYNLHSKMLEASQPVHIVGPEVNKNP